MTVVDRKTKEVVARAEARAEAWGKGPVSLGIQMTGDASPLSFAGISFDDKRVVHTTVAAAQAK